jgi:hypothetical protein
MLIFNVCACIGLSLVAIHQWLWGLAIRELKIRRMVESYICGLEKPQLKSRRLWAFAAFKHPAVSSMAQTSRMLAHVNL